MQKFRIYNAYSYLDKKNDNKKVVVIEALNIGRETRFPKKVFLSLEEARQLGGAGFDENAIGLGFSGKVLVMEEVYGLEENE